MAVTTVTVFNALSGKKQPLVPLLPGKLGLYACGVTVYDYCHLGNARAMVCFDVIVRVLRLAGFAVNFVRNITDVDDKIIVRALERGVTAEEITAQYITAMHDDERALNCLPPNQEPRATESIQAIIQLIERLLAEEFAYVSTDGDVCFEVKRFAAYGQLSNIDVNQLLEGMRVEVSAGKRSPLDFVLWKKAKPGEPQWLSPWGAGRPGWHIECSAMAMAALGEQFDVHLGGIDLKFPHHENEIAQSEAVSHKPLANYWLHVGLLQFNAEKMSKSTGNFLTIQEAVARHHPEVVRYFLLSSHYRSPLNYSEQTIQAAHKALSRLYQSLRDLPCTGEIDQEWVSRFHAVLFDDFNTPVALALLFDLSHEVNKTQSPLLAATLRQLGAQLGLLQADAYAFLQAGETSLSAEAIEQALQARKLAKSDKNWARADAIRAELLAAGIELEDGPTGTTWRLSRNS